MYLWFCDFLWGILHCINFFYKKFIAFRMTVNFLEFRKRLNGEKPVRRALYLFYEILMEGLA